MHLCGKRDEVINELRYGSVLFCIINPHSSLLHPLKASGPI